MSLDAKTLDELERLGLVIRLAAPALIAAARENASLRERVAKLEGERAEAIAFLRSDREVVTAIQREEWDWEVDQFLARVAGQGGGGT